MTGADASAFENAGVVRVPHSVDIADHYRFAHLADGFCLSPILHPRTSPATSRHAGLRPFAEANALLSVSAHPLPCACCNRMARALGRATAARGRRHGTCSRTPACPAAP